MSYTKGSWYCSVFRETGRAPGIDIGAEDNSNVAIVIHQPSDRDAYETKANARLISAAPDLLEALKAIAEGCAFPEDDVQRAILKRAREAIAKAEQKQKTL